MQSNPCTAIKPAAASTFPLPLQLFHLQSSTSISAFPSLAAGVPLLSQHQSTSHSPKIKAAPFLLISIFSAPPSPAVPAVPSLGADCSFSGGKELINHSQFCLLCSEQPQELHPSGLRSLFLGQVIPGSIAVFALITNHPQIAQITGFARLSSATMQQNTSLSSGFHLYLCFVSLSLFYFSISVPFLYFSFISLFQFYFLVPRFVSHSSVFHTRLMDITTFFLFHLTLTHRKAFSSPLSVVPKKPEKL